MAARGPPAPPPVTPLREPVGLAREESSLTLVLPAARLECQAFISKNNERWPPHSLTKPPPIRARHAAAEWPTDGASLVM